MRAGPGARRAAAVTLMVMAAGCTLARPTPELRHWVLWIPPTARAPWPSPVSIGAVAAERPYSSSRLAVRTSPYAIDYRIYDRWAAPPRILVANVLRDALAQESGAGTEIVVEARVDRLEGVALDHQTPSGQVTLALRATRGDTVLVDRTYDESEPAASAGSEDLAAALSRALGRLVARFGDDLRQAVSRRS